jgi:uncharacterized membrane protein
MGRPYPQRNRKPNWCYRVHFSFCIPYLLAVKIREKMAEAALINYFSKKEIEFVLVSLLGNAIIIVKGARQFLSFD